MLSFIEILLNFTNIMRMAFMKSSCVIESFATMKKELRSLT